MNVTFKTKLQIIGGFLGAGKTTAMLRLAKHYQSEGARVGLITNDQAAHLVDTGTLRSNGFRVEEVAGACFCCKFDELAQCAERLRDEEKPNILIAEPVGSCTDLAATVVLPLTKLLGDHYDVAPYSVLVDPVRARQIVFEKGFGGFSSKVAYIFLKQLEEADVICLNKIDILNSPDRARIEIALAAEFPRARVIGISSRTGEGFELWRSLLEASGQVSGRNIAQVDYNIYAEGEAELGWLNATYDVRASAAFSADVFVRDVVARAAERIGASGAETAHLKAMLEAENGVSVANFVGGISRVALSQSTGAQCTEATLTVNARVHIDPAELRDITDRAVADAVKSIHATLRSTDTLHFRPGRPVPTHRYTN